MADVTVAQFAEVLKVPVEKLLSQLDEAGIKVSSSEDKISDDAKLELLTYLRRSHGQVDTPAGDAAPRRITLKRKSQSELKLSGAQGRSRTVNVEVRRKRTYIKRDVLEKQAQKEQEELDRKRREEEDRIEAEKREQERLKAEKEQAARLEEEKRQQEEKARIDAEEEARKAAEQAAAVAGVRKVLVADNAAYEHQLAAWHALLAEEPRSVLVTSGTGSGKTECFLFPILDHCLRARKEGQKGIKAIILYPMNALASDQARRLARMLWDDDGRPRASIFNIAKSVAESFPTSFAG